MIIGDSICPFPVAARITVSRRFSVPVDLIETVFGPFWLIVLLVVMSKYMGVSSMLTITLSGYFNSFRISRTDRMKVAIFSRAAGSFCAMDVLARKEVVSSHNFLNPASGSLKRWSRRLNGQPGLVDDVLYRDC